MSTLVKMIIKMMNRESRFDDTISDRFNHVITTSVLILCSVLITSSQYVGDPIQCWIPLEFNKNQRGYVEDLCWVQGTYFVPFEEENLPTVNGDSRKTNVNYYQWLPLVLLLQALLYGAPHKLWSTLYMTSGLDLENFIHEGSRVNKLNMNDQRDQILLHMASVLDRYLNANNERRKTNRECTLSLKHTIAYTCFRMCSARRLNYLVTLLLFVKTMYVFNSVLQFVALGAILNTNFWLYGFTTTAGLVIGDLAFHGWPFPKVTMCDFKIRRLGNLNNYTVQCALMINLFNEKLFLIIWATMIISLVVSVVSLIKWSIWSLARHDRYRYVKSLLLLARAIKPRKKKKVPTATLR